MRLFSAVLCAIALCALRAAPVLAWGYDGHRIVCAIAWDQLMPEIREKLKRVAEVASKEEFIESCLWPDEVRPWRTETGPYHYVNVPHGSIMIDTQRDCAEKGCVVTQLLIQAADMRQYYSRDAARFVAHFAGDMHQPLHTGYGDDAGGNALKGKFMGRDINFHALWDYGLLDATGRSWQEIAADLSTQITQGDRWAWTSGWVQDWANQTLALALSPAVRYDEIGKTPTQPFDLGRDYLDANLPAVYSQLQKAGTRLAAILTNFLQ